MRRRLVSFYASICQKFRDDHCFQLPLFSVFPNYDPHETDITQLLQYVQQA